VTVEPRDPAVGPGELADRVAALRGRLASASQGADIGIVAVTKGFGPATVGVALQVGLNDLGENYPDELLAKAEKRAGGAETGHPRWHFLGAVQRRHVGPIAPLVALWHGICRVEEGRAIAKANPGARVLVQVELSGLPSRRGVSPESAELLVEQLADCGVVPCGVMTMGVAGDTDVTRNVFRQAAGLARRLGLAEVSMGMSDDFEVAAAEGATMVRIGRALFGERGTRFARDRLQPK
jgi:uncharacterized pyridoxal phosphate-containing UPF0001 family protein